MHATQKQFQKRLNKRQNTSVFKQGQKGKKYVVQLKQVTRGHNIVADGWAEAANPDTRPTPHQTAFQIQTHTQKASKRSFSHFSTCVHRLMDGPTDGQTKPLIELRVRN